MAITREQAQAQLDLWLTASAAVAAAQSYEIAGRKLTRADAAEVRRQIDYWEAKLDRLSRGRGLSFSVGVPR